MAPNPCSVTSAARCVAEEEILDRFVQGVEEPGFSHFSQQAGAVKQVTHSGGKLGKQEFHPGLPRL